MVLRVKVLSPAYQLFFKLVTLTIIDAPIVPVIVIFRVSVDCWKQETVIPLVEVVHAKPTLRVIVLGIMIRMLSPE